ncbi:MAG: hypothetical protein U0T84_02900 [Chitinophagales bacterium]
MKNYLFKAFCIFSLCSHAQEEGFTKVTINDGKTLYCKSMNVFIENGVYKFECNDVVGKDFNMGDGENEVETVWTGIVRDISSPTPGVYNIECSPGPGWCVKTASVSPKKVQASITVFDQEGTTFYGNKLSIIYDQECYGALIEGDVTKEPHPERLESPKDLPLGLKIPGVFLGGEVVGGNVVRIQCTSNPNSTCFEINAVNTATNRPKW